MDLAGDVLHTGDGSSRGEPTAINLLPVSASSLPISFHWGEKSYACDFHEIYGWGESGGWSEGLR